MKIRIQNKKRRKLTKVLLILLLIFFVGMAYSYYEARHLQHRRYDYVNKDIPKSFEGKKIVFISDIHSNVFFDDEDVADLVRVINGMKPDIVIIGGDHIDGDSKYVKPYYREMKKLESKLGVYTVLGNHDHWWNASKSLEYLTDNGFKICDNRSYWVKEGNDSIKIGGVGDFWEDEQILENTVKDVNENDLCILVSHNPDYMEKFTSDTVDLMLSGHTHAGQITFFGLWAPITSSTFHPEYMQTGQKYLYGWKKKGETSLYVSSGVGVGKIPFRFFSKPEIVEITLKR